MKPEFDEERMHYEYKVRTKGITITFQEWKDLNELSEKLTLIN